MFHSKRDNNKIIDMTSPGSPARRQITLESLHRHCLPWSCADRDSWCCWYFSAIASVLLSCLCTSYEIIPPYNIPQTTVTSRRHWKILRCLREHTPFPMLDPHPSPLSARQNPVSAAGNFPTQLLFFFLPPGEDPLSLPSLPEHFQAETTT